MRPGQATRDSGNAPDVPRVVVENLQHDLAEVATIAARPPNEVLALEKRRASRRRAKRIQEIFGLSYGGRNSGTRLGPAKDASETTERKRTRRPARSPWFEGADDAAPLESLPRSLEGITTGREAKVESERGC